MWAHHIVPTPFRSLTIRGKCEQHSRGGALAVTWILFGYYPLPQKSGLDRWWLMFGDSCWFCENMFRTWKPLLKRCFLSCFLLKIYGGVPWVYPQVIHFNRIFHEINHPAIGVPPFMEHDSSDTSATGGTDLSAVLRVEGNDTWR